MADTSVGTSPLQPWAARFAKLPDSVVLEEEPFVTMVDLRLDPSGPGAAAVAELLGVELPTKVSTYAKNADTTVIWLGPDEWLVTDTALAGPELEARLREAVATHGGVAIDVSGQRTTLRLRGSRSRDVLAKGCALDLHPTGHCRGNRRADDARPNRRHPVGGQRNRWRLSDSRTLLVRPISGRLAARRGGGVRTGRTMI